MNTKWIDDLFYFLNKDYGTTIVYTKIGKADVDYDTGSRQDIKQAFEIPGVAIPITLYQEYLDKLTRLGNSDSVDRAKTRFLFRKCDMSFEVETLDYFVHGPLRYTQLVADDLLSLWSVAGVATRGALPYRVLNLSATDNLGLGDGV